MKRSEPIRKACDFCYRRRFKCDSQKPRCSHCVLYDSECTHKTAPRKAAPKKRASSSRESALESRIRTLEAQLSTTLERLESIERDHPPGSSSDISSLTFGDAEENIPLSTPDPGHEAMPLDSLHDILPVIEWYLATKNSLVPLFDASNLLTAVKDWYHKPHTRERTVWAMINVVLALAHHNGYSGRKPHSINDTSYIKNAQSVLTDAIANDTKLMHVQVLIGLAMLFRTAHEPTPAVVLSATALRLAHKLGLHRRSAKQYDSAMCLQRDRVFWIAYILDRSISSQTRISPIQLDSDIDLDLPPLEPLCDDLGGFVITDDRHPKFSFFRANVQMARIQGLVHKYVYSGSAQKLSAAEKAHNVALIHRELDAWTAQIPHDFHPITLSQSEDMELSRHFCMLYSARLSCRAIISYGSLLDSFHYSKWVESLQGYGERIVSGEIVTSITDQRGWKTLVDESRDYLRLFMKFKSKDAVFTMTTLCAHTTSLICLVAQNMSNTHRGIRASDDPLIDIAMAPLGDIVKQTGSLRDTYNAIEKLRAYAQAMSQHQDSQLSNFPSEPTWLTSSTSEATDPEILNYLFAMPDGESLWNLQHPTI
ncbi:hypothetical protein F5Y12DRAFT_753175 [Xylaria sp. FL1777]|nr:hypothetical protein F5Y12DRAFT_753175 [Xylaria sp. FL1777]